MAAHNQKVAAAARKERQKAEHLHHLGRRYRPVEHQRLLAWGHGLPHAEYRPGGQGRDDLHRLLRRAKLHGGSGLVHHRPAWPADRTDQGRLAGATLGLQKEDPTIAELLKPLGYATGQFGKNHLGDRNEFLPTVHGFDEFYRQPVPPERRRRTGTARLSEGSGVPTEVRPARRAGLQGHATRTTRPSTRGSARSASRSSRTPAR